MTNRRGNGVTGDGSACKSCVTTRVKRTVGFKRSEAVDPEIAASGGKVFCSSAWGKRAAWIGRFLLLVWWSAPREAEKGAHVCPRSLESNRLTKMNDAKEKLKTQEKIKINGKQRYIYSIIYLI